MPAFIRAEGITVTQLVVVLRLANSEPRAATMRVAVDETEIKLVNNRYPAATSAGGTVSSEETTGRRCVLSFWASDLNSVAFLVRHYFTVRTCRRTF